MATHHYTDKTYYEYDATLTQGLLTKYINTLSSSTATKTDMTYLWSIGNMSRFTGSRHEPNPEVTSGESEEPRPSTVTHDYVNFVNATGVDFDQARSAAVAAGLSANTIPNGISLNDIGLQATNITFAEGGAAGAYASNTTLSNLTFLGRGGVVEIGGGFVEDANGSAIFVGGQSLNGLTAEQDLDTIVLYPPSKEAATSAVTATNITVSRNLRDLAVATVDYYSFYGRSVNYPASGVEASKITVHGALNHVNIANGATVDNLSAGTQRSWTSADRNAFGYFDSNWNSWTYSSATYMNIESGGTASNIFLGNGGQVIVSGPSDRKISTWNETKQEWEYTTSYASGTGGVLKNLYMATSGGLVFDGITDPTATWQNANNVYWGSYGYKSHYLASAPQSAYVQFESNTIGSNINIGNGGSMRISSGASVVGISMGALTTSTFHTNSGNQMTWVGDRGAKLVIDGGFASNVVVEGAPLTRDYYFAQNNGFSNLSFSIQSAYYESHGSNLDSNAASALAAAGYNAYMSSCYNETLSDYGSRYVGGLVDIGGGAYVDKLSGFARLHVTGDGVSTSSGGSVSYSAYNGSVTNVSGALSATVNVGGGAHLSNVVVQGGYFVMGANSGGVTRWTNQENPQSNFARVEDLNLRTSGLVGDNNSAVIVFTGGGSGGWSEGSYDDEGHWQLKASYSYDCTDPGEIVNAVGDSGLRVQGTYGHFTYTGSGAVTLHGLGTVMKEEAGSRCYSSTTISSGSSTFKTISRWLTPSSTRYDFGVVKGVFDEEGKLQEVWGYNGDGGFDWTGTLAIGSGAIVKDVGSKNGLKTANTLTSTSWNPVIEEDVSKKLVVLAGGSADNVAVTGKVTNYHVTSQYLYQSNAALVVSSGGKATNISVLSNGIAMAVGGTIDGAFVGSGGILYLSGWGGALQVSDDNGKTIAGPQYLDEGVLNNVHLDKGGQLAGIFEYQFGGKTPSIIANTGAGVLNGVTANGVAYMSGVDFAGGVNLGNGQKALDVTVRGFTTVTETDSNGNPTAWNTTIAYMNVSSGGIVSGATVGEDGAIYVSDGAAVSNLDASGGRLIFGNSSGWSDYFPGSASVAGITVRDGGILEVNSKFALKATDMQVKESAGLELAIVKDADENYAKTELNGTWTAGWGSGTFATTDGVLSGFGGQFGFEYTDPIYGSKYTSARLSMTFLNSATLLDADMRGYGYFTVRDGAKVLNTKIKGITANIGGGGYASGLFAMTDPTGSAYDTNIYVYGNSQKGTIGFAEKTVMSGGYMMVEDGGKADGVTMLAPEGYEGPAGDSKKVGPVELEVVAGGTVSNVYASAGVVTIAEGSKDPGTGPSTLSNAEIHSSAMLLVNADGVVLDGALKLAGTVVTTAERYKYVEVVVTDPDTGDTYTDWQRMTLNNAVADAKTLTVSFDLTEHSEGFETAMIDNMANLDGAKYEFIYVNENQATGSYVLAGSAQDYKTGALKVVRGGKSAGTITVSDGWGVLQVDDDLTYTVNHNANNELVFSVENTDAAITNIVATSDGKELLKGKWSKYSVNIKTEVNKYTTSIWYRIKQAVKPKTRDLLSAPGDVDDDGWIEFDNDKGIDITEYCTVELKAKNEAGKDSEIVSYTVNYDAIAPVIDGLRLVSGEPFLTPGVESAVVVSVTDDLDATPALQLSLNDDVWTDVIHNDDGSYIFNLTGGIEGFTLRAIDHAENETVLSVSVPDDPVAAADIISVTNQDVTVSAEFSADAMIKEFSTDGGQTWEAYDNGVVLKDNATVSFRAGNFLGYSDTVELTIDYIDKIAPNAPNAVADITEPTNNDVTVTATFSEDSVKKLYTLDGGETWEDYNEGGVIIIINGTVGFCGVDAAGNMSDMMEVNVNNIDKEAPEAPAELVAEVDDRTVTLSWAASIDNLAGVKEYVVSYSHDGQEFSVNTSETSFVIEDADPATWQWSVKAVDNVGNVSGITNGEAFTVVESVEPEPEKTFITKSDIDGNDISDVLFVWTGEHGEGNYQQGYWLNGTNTWQSANAAHPSDWIPLGAHDMNNDGKADSVMFGNVYTETSGKGAYIGYYLDADDNSTPEHPTWQNIGYLNNEEDIAWQNCVGNMNGEKNSIVWYAPDLYATGIWVGQDEYPEWIALSASFGGPDWNLVGCGDFDGDGRDSVVMNYNNGQFFYAVGIDGATKSLGTLQWIGWQLRAIGDFSGDGKDDLVLFHEETGSMVMCADGNIDDYKSIGQLAFDDWFVVGAGDYNGDQKDDLLVRQYSTGMLGYYSSGDTSQWVELGRGVGMDWTVIA